MLPRLMVPLSDFFFSFFRFCFFPSFSTFDRTWNSPMVAKVLANTANYMICDDHEVVDDFGERENVRSFIFFSLLCPYRMYIRLRASVAFSSSHLPAYALWKSLLREKNWCVSRHRRFLFVFSSTTGGVTKKVSPVDKTCLRSVISPAD